MTAPILCDVTEKMKDEWLEADGLGGFASGTVSGFRTRRYHALLLAATRPPAGRMVLVNGVDAWLDTGKSVIALSSQLYAPRVMHPDGACRIVEFRAEPWPQWTYALENGARVQHEIFVVRGASIVVMSWHLLAPIVKAVLMDAARTSLSGPGEPGYIASYQGAVRERDSAYHQGTVWPWLIGAFVEAWVRVRGGSAAAKREAHWRFVLPLLEHLSHAGLGHVSEIADPILRTPHVAARFRPGHLESSCASTAVILDTRTAVSTSHRTAADGHLSED